MNALDDLKQDNDKRIKTVIENIQKALRPNDEDPEQKGLIQAIQEHRQLILDIASNAYICKPGDPKFLEALSTLISQMEKTVRDDRKERMKKQEQEDNKVSFRQMVDALKSLATGELDIPTFGDTDMILDPSKSLNLLGDVGKIRPDEIVTGHVMLNFEGEEIKDI